MFLFLSGCLLKEFFASTVVLRRLHSDGSRPDVLIRACTQVIFKYIGTQPEEKELIVIETNQEAVRSRLQEGSFIKKLTKKKPG